MRAKLRDSLLLSTPSGFTKRRRCWEAAPAQPGLAGILEKLHVWWRVNLSPPRLADNNEAVAEIQRRARLDGEIGRTPEPPLPGRGRTGVPAGRPPIGRMGSSYRPRRWPSWYKQHPECLEDAWG